MTTTTHKRPTSEFSKENKHGLEPGQELIQDGLIWRKRQDGTGTWRYDFVHNGERYKGTIGAEKDGATLSQARSFIAEIKAKAITDRLAGRTGRSRSGQRKFEEAAEAFLQWSQARNLSTCFEHVMLQIKSFPTPLWQP